MKEKPIQIEDGEWFYMGCIIQKSIHPKLDGKYEVFRKNESETHLGRCYTFSDAMKLCEENYLPFDFEKFKEYVNSYDPKKHGGNDQIIIISDMLYGIGISLDPERFGNIW